LTARRLGTLLVLGLLMGAGSLALAILSAPILLTAGYAPMVPVIIAATIAVQFTGIWLWPFAVVLESELRFKPLAVATSIATVLSYLPAFWAGLQRPGAVQPARAVCYEQPPGDGSHGRLPVSRTAPSSADALAL
jgi:hypothetical protein